MYRIAKRFGFSASHVLHGLGDDHPCSRMHGHNYEIEVIAEADDLDGRGFVVDFRELDVDLAATWSCYKGAARHCGTCGTCVERREAFALAGVPDPTTYDAVA